MALSAYVHARAAETAAPLADAASAYSAALTLTPDNQVLAARALRTGLWAGDEALAVRAAQLLDKAGALGPEGRLLLAAEAIKDKRWKLASAQADKLAADQVFAFMAPVLRAWIAQGSGSGDPAAILAAGADPRSPLATYAPEQRALLLVAKGDKAEALAALQPLFAHEDRRDERLRLLLAGQLARRGWRPEAIALLEGEAAQVREARARLASGRTWSTPPPGAAAGVADFLLCLSSELATHEVPELALSLARIAGFLVPSSSEAAMGGAELLAARGQPDAALAALAAVPADDLYAASTATRRLAILEGAGRTPEALAEARAAASKAPGSVDSWTRLGDLLVEGKSYDEAADVYAKALAANGADGPGPAWVLWLLRGNALMQGGRWPEAKAALQEAYKLAPQQPTVLNVLGYSQLERRENVAEATRLVEEASRRQPDDAAITDSLGWAYYLQGSPTRALPLLERAAKGQPGDAAINEHLGDAYYAVGRRYEARYAWRAALVYADETAAGRLRAKIEAGLSPAFAAP